MIAMGLVTDWRTGAGIAGLAEIIDGLTKAIGEAFGAVSLLEPLPVWRNIESSPMMEYFGQRVRVVAHEQEASGALWNAGPSEWRRDVVTIAGVFLWYVSSLSKRGTR
jgi:hypothetical protein